MGALIVIERETGLDNIVATGTRLDAVVSQDLLHTVFFPGSPLHDGAAVIRSNRVLAVGCTLPLSDSPHISSMIHTRHKAAVGVTEQSDAVVVVVSEETGTISLAVEGRLERGLDADALRERLQKLLIPQERATGAGYRMLFRRHSAQQERQKPAAEQAAGSPDAAAQETRTGAGPV